jgi:predicted Zn-dependent protease with MMP-like domain
MPKLPEDYQAYVKTALARVTHIKADYTLDTLPTLDIAFDLLGKAITRRDILKDLADKINYTLGNGGGIPIKVKEIQEYMELFDHQIKTVNEMIRAILMKEVPHVPAYSKSVDVQVK